MKVWILTYEVNAYDQYGEYFQAVFANKPTHEQLTKHGVPQHALRHVLNGGGRIKFEDEWWILELVECE